MRTKLIELIQKHALSRGNFVLASGQISDHYIDLSKIVLDSAGLYLIASLVIEEVDKWKGITAIGGPAYGAISIISGILTLMHDSEYPMKGFFIRKESKTYGKQELIEGNLKDGDKVILVEDVTTTGKSLLKVLQEIEKFVEISQIISVVDRNQGASE